MTQDIRWKPYVWDAPRPTTPREIALLEQEWSAELPAEYKKLVSTNQGMTPTPCVFSAGKVRDVMSVLLTITSDPDKRAYAVRDSYGILQPHIPSRIYPFAMTPGSEHLCFDYRDSPDEPSIVLVTVEMDIYPVADNFNDFLAGLHDA
ncbi:SMI1/KNR4 family protein [Archangium violaceum]|uniref:SMI1/KNR4 family protein n=1 Tax=Archangium violaceum TaxID=83451 RepID=UPI00194E2CD1|nr:SMI1/KNR4 family protein [Archangium violaceum]QRN99103.1 SMI1/KNR4 family protein [Archangium violaceum]